MLTLKSVLFKSSWSDSFAEAWHRCNQQRQEQWLLAVRASPGERMSFSDEAMLPTCAPPGRRFTAGMLPLSGCSELLQAGHSPHQRAHSL